MDVSMVSPDVIDMIAFGPDILSLIQVEIQARKLSYKQIGSRVHTAAGTIGSWFSRGTIPADKVFSVVAAVGGAKLWMQVLSRIPGNVFSCQYLDGVDEHPKPVIEDAAEIAESLIELAKRTQKVLRHREAGHQFGQDDDRILLMFEDSIADSIIIGQMVLVRLEDYYGRSARNVMDRQERRMRERGYCSVKGKTASSGQLTVSSKIS